MNASLFWVPGHLGVTEYQNADALARSASTVIVILQASTKAIPYTGKMGVIMVAVRKEQQRLGHPPNIRDINQKFKSENHHSVRREE